MSAAKPRTLPPFTQRLAYLFSLICLLLTAVGATYSQNDVQLHVSQPDLSAFPQISFILRSSNGRSVPLPDYDALSLRENGVPVSDFSRMPIPAGIDIVFVIDSSPSFLTLDDNIGQTEYEVVRDTILRYGSRYMNPNGQDRLSIIVPNAANDGARLLAEPATTLDDLQAALDGYTATAVANPPLTSLMTAALAQLAATPNNGRFQAVLLFTEATDLPVTLDTATVVSQAQQQQIPIFVSILGAQVTPDELDNAARLYQPTRGFYVRLPAAPDADPIFLVWQRQGTPTRITYTSLLRDNGRYPLTINVGSSQTATEIVLDLSPPDVELALDSDVIRRVGTAVDTPLTDLVPAVQPLPFTVTWRDSTPRQLASVELLVDGQAQPVAKADLSTEADGLMAIRWDVRGLEGGAYELAVRVTDTLGKSATSASRLVTILTERPLPPTRTALPPPTATAAPPLAALTNRAQWQNPIVWLGGGLVLLVGLLLLPLWRRRNRAQPVAATPAADIPTPSAPTPTALHPMQTAVLLPHNSTQPRLVLGDSNITIGRDPASVQIALADRTVSPLHARIRRRDGHYWLYDEGSGSGTFLNRQQLGLQPQLLQPGDQVRIGRLSFTFQLVTLTDEEE